MGDQDEKLAEGIKLYALSVTPTSKRTVLSDLITVSFISFFLQIRVIVVLRNRNLTTL